MVYIKGKDKQITITEKEYLTLIEDHLTIRALKIAGIEKMPIYESIRSIMENDLIEVHIRPVKKRYK